MVDFDSNKSNDIKKLILDVKSPLTCLKMISNYSKKTIAEEKDQLLYFINQITSKLDTMEKCS